MKTNVLFTLVLPLIFGATSLSAQWAKMETHLGDTVNALQLSAVDRNVVWAMLEKNFFNPVNTVIHTADGGQTWQVSSFSDDPLDLVTDIFAVSATDAWVLAFNVGDFTGKLQHTADGGQTWSARIPDAFDQPGAFPNIVHFFDDGNGLLMGDPYDGQFLIFTTADGGLTWTRVDAAQMPAPQSGEYGVLGTYAVRGDRLQFVTTTNRVWTTYDRGHTWSAVQLPTQNPVSQIAGIAYADDQNGLLVYNQNLGEPFFTPPPQNKPLRTYDGGQTWEVLTGSNGDTFDEYGSLTHVPGTASAFVAGNYDGYAFTKDFGMTWTYAENSNFRLPYIECVDAQTCFGGLWSSTSNTSGDVARWVGPSFAPNTGAQTGFNFRITPNPATGSTQAQLLTPLPTDVSVYLMNGHTILRSTTIPAGSTAATLDLVGVLPGVYFVRAVSGTAVKAVKFFVQ